MCDTLVFSSNAFSGLAKYFLHTTVKINWTCGLSNSTQKIFRLTSTLTHKRSTTVNIHQQKIDSENAKLVEVIHVFSSFLRVCFDWWWSVHSYLLSQTRNCVSLPNDFKIILHNLLCSIHFSSFFFLLLALFFAGHQSEWWLVRLVGVEWLCGWNLRGKPAHSNKNLHQSNTKWRRSLLRGRQRRTVRLQK